MRKALAIIVFIALMAAMVPAASAAVSVTTVNVFNYARSGPNLYDPDNNSNFNFLISAPYDNIAWSSANGTTRAPHYRVIFTLSSSIDPNRDKVYLNGSYLDYGYNDNGRIIVDSNEVSCIFIAQRGGNTKSFTLNIYDDSDNTTTSHTATVTYYDTWAATSPANNVAYMSASRNSGNYTVWSSGQTIYIDYNSAYHPLGSLLDVDFTFSDIFSSPIPSTGTAQLVGVSSNGNTPFVPASQYGTAIRSQFAARLSTLVAVDPTNTSVSFTVEAGGRRYTTPSYNVIWRDMWQGAEYGSRDSLTITPSRTPVVTVGQDYTLTITSNNVLNTGAYFTLDVSGQAGIVTTATGKYLTIRGVRPGSTYVNVRDSYGNILTALYVTVVSQNTTSAQGIGTYQVSMFGADVYNGPGTGYSYLGRASGSTYLTVYGFEGNWARIAWNSGTAYVSAANLTYISSSYASSTYTTATTTSSVNVGTGVYKTVLTASTDVFNGPGSANTRLGAIMQGQRVYVISVTNSGWALVNWAGGTGYVSLANLK